MLHANLLVFNHVIVSAGDHIIYRLHDVTEVEEMGCGVVDEHDHHDHDHDHNDEQHMDTQSVASASHAHASSSTPSSSIHLQAMPSTPRTSGDNNANAGHGFKTQMNGGMYHIACSLLHRLFPKVRFFPPNI
jgi:hypothetical protein